MGEQVGVVTGGCDAAQPAGDQGDAAFVGDDVSGAQRPAARQEENQSGEQDGDDQPKDDDGANDESCRASADLRASGDAAKDGEEADDEEDDAPPK